MLNTYEAGKLRRHGGPAALSRCALLRRRRGILPQSQQESGRPSSNKEYDLRLMNVIVSTAEPAILAKHFRLTVAARRGSSKRRDAANSYARLQAEDVVELCALSVLFVCVLVSTILAANSVILFLSSNRP